MSIRNTIPRLSKPNSALPPVLSYIWVSAVHQLRMPFCVAIAAYTLAAGASIGTWCERSAMRLLLIDLAGIYKLGQAAVAHQFHAETVA